MRIFRNVFRRKMRAFLTIFGITIGVFALVVMGSMAEKINLMVSGGTRYYSDKVVISDASTPAGGFSTTPIAVSRIPEIENVPGVARATASIYLLLDPEGGMSMGVPQGIVGSDLRAQGYETFELRMKEGRDLAVGDEGKAVVGSDIAKALGATVGGTVQLRGKPFEVVGIYDKTLTAPDNTVTVSLHDVQQLLYAELPVMVQQQVNPDDLATAITAYPTPGVDADQLASTIEGTVSNVKASGPTTFINQFKSMTKIFNSIIFGVALISLLVGGLSVVNTMTMSVLERTREIGIRKAIGATRGNILLQFLVEALTLCLLGGVIGILGGWGAAVFFSKLNGWRVIVTPTAIALAVGFSVMVGLFFGVWPARQAASLDPIEALRYE
jgi:putative ABC transport system permease protein